MSLKFSRYKNDFLVKLTFLKKCIVSMRPGNRLFAIYHVFIIAYRFQYLECRARRDNYRSLSLAQIFAKNPRLFFRDRAYRHINHIEAATTTRGFIDVSIFQRVRRGTKATRSER